MSFDIFQNIMTASDPAGGRAIKVTLQTGIDDAESYYTKSDSAGGRAIKVSLVGSGALILAGNVPLSTTPTNVADGAGSTSPLQLGTTRIVMNTGAAASRSTLQITSIPFTSGSEDTNHPVLLFGAHGGSIWAASPNGGTYLGINAVASFPGNFLDFRVNAGASVFKVAASGALTSSSTITAGGIISSTAASGNGAFSLSGGQIFQAAGYNFYSYSSRHFFDSDNRGVAFGGNMYIGANTATNTRLHVLGALTQNIVRFDDSTSTSRFIIPNSGPITIGSGVSINAISFFAPTTFNGETLLTSMGNAGYGSCFYFSGSSGSANFTTLGVNIGATTNAKGALLRLGAGTAAANTAPLKFTAGTNLTTPENGAFEFDGSFLYFTIGGVRLKVTLAP